MKSILTQNSIHFAFNYALQMTTHKHSLIMTMYVLIRHLTDSDAQFFVQPTSITKSGGHRTRPLTRRIRQDVWMISEALYKRRTSAAARGFTSWTFFLPATMAMSLARMKPWVTTRNATTAQSLSSHIATSSSSCRCLRRFYR